MFSRFFKDIGGAAIVELSLVAPVIAAMVLVSYGVWDAAARRQDMSTGLDAAATYYMNGGADDAVAKAAALNAWDQKPAGATVAASRSCRCGVTAGTCNVLCNGTKWPAEFVQLTATGTTTGVVFVPTLTEQRTIRVK